VQTFKLKNLDTGEILERDKLDAQEIVARNNGRIVHLEDAPADEPKQEVSRKGR
jgi:hypothetical protein